MHRTIEITVPSAEREALVRDLERLEDVIGLAVHPRAARKPKGDLIIVQALNQGTDDVLRCVSKGREGHVHSLW